MKHLEPIKIIATIVMTLLISNCITAQHKIDKDVTFSFKGKNSYIPLNTFLAYYKFDKKNLSNCMTASGILKFEVTPKGKITSISSEGNLPDDLIKLVKERILLTEDHWILSDSILKSGKNIEFYYPLYMEINIVQNCKTTIHESYDLLNKLLGNQKVLHVRNEIYVIAPEIWHSIR